MKKLLSTAFIFAATISTATVAHATHELNLPYVEKGDAEIEYYGRHDNDSKNTNNNFQKHSLAFGYGVTESWGVEVAGIFEKEPDSETKFDAIELENLFQLTEKNEYFLDVGALLAYEHTPQNNRPDAAEAQLILAKEWCKTFHVANLTIEDEIGSGNQGTPEGKFLWSSRYKYSELFNPGFEIFSEFGHLNNLGGFNDQEHYIGPAAYGELEIYSGEDDIELEYRLAYLFGVSDAAHDGELIAQIGYEFEF